MPSKIIIGPKGGAYTISKGKKVYIKKNCNCKKKGFNFFG